MCENVSESQRSFYNLTRGGGGVESSGSKKFYWFSLDDTLEAVYQTKPKSTTIGYNIWFTKINSFRQSIHRTKAVFVTIQRFLNIFSFRLFDRRPIIWSRSSNYRLFRWMYRHWTKPRTSQHRFVKQYHLSVFRLISCVSILRSNNYRLLRWMYRNWIKRLTSQHRFVKQCLCRVFCGSPKNRKVLKGKDTYYTRCTLHPGKSLNSSCSPTCVISRRNEKSLMSSSVTTTT